MVWKMLTMELWSLHWKMIDLGCSSMWHESEFLILSNNWGSTCVKIYWICGVILLCFIVCILWNRRGDLNWICNWFVLFYLYCILNVKIHCEWSIKHMAMNIKHLEHFLKTFYGSEVQTELLFFLNQLLQNLYEAWLWNLFVVNLKSFLGQSGMPNPSQVWLMLPVNRASF